MKPFDTKSEYTPEEVKAALAGADGTRQLSYRYERLDKNNKFIENIDYVQACTIENNALADIKRTAKIDILDTGSINYLQDRIKPYIRLAMPADKDYNNSVRESDPDIWWRFDDTVVANRSITAADIADGLTYNTRATAFNLDLSTSDKSSNVKLISGSGTLRSEVWFKTTVTDSAALLFESVAVGSHSGMGYEIYTSPADTDPLTLAYPLPDDNVFNDYSNGMLHPFPFPVRGLYYFRLFTTGTGTAQQLTLRTSRPKRLEDSSDNGFYAVGRAIGTGGAPVIGGGNSVAGNSTWSASKINSSMDAGLVMNFWQFADVDAPTYNGINTYISYATREQDEWFLSYTIDHYDGSPTGYLSVTMGYWYGGMEVPLDKIKGTHMWTLSYEPDSSRPLCLYIDGEYIGELVDQGSSVTLAEAEADFDTAVLTNVDVQMNSNTNVRVDDMTVFFRPVPTDQLVTLYRDGMDLDSLNKRSGFVEWPQGVFLLSSPSRQMVNGNQIVRSVEGYDQLVVLKEDSFDYRYSVKQGVKYTDAVKQVLQSTSPTVTVPLTSSDWTVGGDVLSSTSMTLGDDVYTEEAYTVHGDYSYENFSMSAKIQSGANNWYEFAVYSDDTTAYFSKVNSVLYANYYFNGSTKVVGALSGYSSTTHAYVKIEKVAGFIEFSTSPDGVTWTLLARTIDKEAANSGLQFFILPNTHATDRMVITDFKAVAAKTVQMSVEDNTRTLPAGMDWEPGTTKLQIVNDLLTAINYESAFYDEDGMFIGKRYIRPQDRASGFRYATDSESVITGDVGQTMDLFGVPNKWVIVVSEPDRPVLVGSYINNNPLSPTSTVARGRTIVDFRTEQNAPDQVTLDDQAARLAYEASQIYEVIEFDTALMPIHQNADVYDLIIDGLVVDSKYSEHSWSMTLSNGSTMSHKVRKVVSV